MKITGFEKIERFREFSLIKCRVDHSVCSFSFVSASFEDYSDTVGSCAEVMDDNNIIMHGMIDDISFVSGCSENIVKVTLISTACKEDVNPINRVFQKEGQTYKDILDAVTQNISYELNVPASLKEAELAHPIVQYNETDYAFIKRMLYEAYGEEIVVDVAGGRNIYVGYIDNSKHEIELTEIYAISHTLKRDMDEIEFSIQGGTEGQELRSYVDIGKQVTWQKNTFIITRIEIEKTESVYRYKCYAKSCKAEEYRKDNKCNHLFTAKITEVDDPDHYGRVRLDFSDVDIEDMTSDDKVWVNVLTPYTAKNGGFVFVPEVDDIVKVLWNGHEFVVVGCVRQEPLAERYQDVKLKQIGNLHDKNICWDEEKIEITSKEAAATLFDKEVNISIGDSSINMSKEKIDIKTKKSIVGINDDIVVDTGTVHVDSGELEEKVKKKYVCESKNITLNASSTVTIEGRTKVSIN